MFITLLINQKRKQYEVPVKNLSPDIKGFDFPEEVRRILRQDAEASRTLVRLLSDVADGRERLLPVDLTKEVVAA